MTKTIENKKVNNFQTVKALVFNSINLLSKHVTIEFEEETKENYNAMVIDSTLKDIVKDIVISKTMIECIYAFDTVVLANSNLKDKKEEFTSTILQSFKDTKDTEEIKQACNDFYKDFTKQAMKIVKNKKYIELAKAFDNLTKAIALGEFKQANSYMKRVFDMEMHESTLKDVQKMIITFDSKQVKASSKNYRCNGLIAILRYTLQKQNAYKRKALQFELKDVMKEISVMTEEEIQNVDVTQYAVLHDLYNGNKLKLTSKVYNHIAKNVVIIPQTIKQAFDTIK